jgi:hypothetical protein
VKTLKVIAAVYLSIFAASPLAAQTGSDKSGSKSKATGQPTTNAQFTTGPQSAAAAKADQTKATLTQAAKQGQVLPSDLTVNANVTIQAVLIPYRVAKHVFGKEIAKNYAVIEVNINNKSPDASLIIQGAFLDYTDWALSGSVKGSIICAQTSQGAYQTCSQPNQVSSEEYRVARGELLDAQTWTWRNGTVRLLTLVGSIASGYSFALSNKDIIKGISEFGSTVVPGVSTFWPDQTVDQLNRISDFGYKTNKVISRQSSDIIVCFFPIDRFLTAGFKKLFLDSPAVFFSPFQMVVDSSLEKNLDELMQSAFGVPPEKLDDTVRELKRAFPCYVYLTQREPSATSELDAKLDAKMQQACLANGTATIDPQILAALELVRKVSLNTTRVVIDGVMTVESTTLAGKIESVVFDGEDTNAALWTKVGELKATIKGSYLTSGAPKIQEATSLGITDTAALTAGSNDETLPISLKTTKAIPNGQKLTFLVEKQQKGSNGEQTTLDSAPFVYTVSTDPVITDTKLTDKVFDVKGKRFFDTSDAPLTVGLMPSSGALISIDKSKVSLKSAAELSFPQPDTLPAGCWAVQISTGKPAPTTNQKDAGTQQPSTTPPTGQKVAVAPQPTIKTATLNKDSVDVEGQDFADTSACGGSTLAFQFIETKDGKDSTPISAKPTNYTAEKAAFAIPTGLTPATKSNWKIEVLLDKTTKSSQPIK